MTTKSAPHRARTVRLLRRPRLLPMEHCARVDQAGPRAISDYIAGMTDRFAIREHRRLFAVGEI